jgi:predicted negative regulator of RcsB-dependent stress response
MATQLDFQEQEQIDQLKAFWKTYGNLITAVLTIALLAFAGWNGYQWWMRGQSMKAGALYEELDRAARAGDADKAARVFSDMKERYGRTAYAQQAALLTAKVQVEKQQPDAAVATLSWAGEKAADDEYRTMARLRAAGVLLDQKRYDEALKQLDGAKDTHFAGLVADRRGDVLQAQGKTEEAKAAFQQAYAALEAAPEYRRLVEAKLTVMGAAPAESKDAAKDKAAR